MRPKRNLLNDLNDYDFKFILFIFFSVIMVQKQNEQFLNEEFVF